MKVQSGHYNFETVRDEHNLLGSKFSLYYRQSSSNSQVLFAHVCYLSATIIFVIELFCS